MAALAPGGVSSGLGATRLPVLERCMTPESHATLLKLVALRKARNPEKGGICLALHPVPATAGTFKLCAVDVPDEDATGVSKCQHCKGLGVSDRPLLSPRLSSKTLEPAASLVATLVGAGATLGGLFMLCPDNCSELNLSSYVKQCSLWPLAIVCVTASSESLPAVDRR